MFYLKMNHKILVLAGPTAVGKTALSIELAKRLNGEIVSTVYDIFLRFWE